METQINALCDFLNYSHSSYHAVAYLEKLLDKKAFDRFTAEIEKSDLLGGFYLPCDKRARTADGAEIDRLVAHYRVHHLGGTLSFSYHRTKPEVEQPRGKGVHTRGRRRSAGADGHAVFAGRGTGIVDSGAAYREGEFPV